MQREQEVEIGSPRCRVTMISIGSPVLAGYQDDPAFTGGGSSSYNADNAMH
jgi:hypothetical protein